VDLNGRTALLTGATGGIGEATARALAGRGVRLILSARNRSALTALADELPGEGHRVVAADLAVPGAADQLAAEAGDVDILVANAGLSATGLLGDSSAEEIGAALRVNLEAPILLARALSPAMLAKDEGQLVFVTSLAGKAASPRTAIYNATKFGLRGFTLALRADLTGTGVGASIVAPGFIRDAGMFAKSGARAPAGLGTSTPEEVGAGVIRAIERNQMEVVVAPLLQRAASHFALAAPGISGRAQSGSAGQKAAAAIDAGHRKDN
jgi:short-subunit dehydrogenase